ncbi:putative phosphoglycerate mutase family protein [Diplodia seriata]|uniref:Putative phosphoglycerate mutase family protein n=1 Tax=Diplodia seriata TaxID=420778 RepID=A0A0G2F1J3_9PEZI|nr:putative phosphoglycerate mutase family protein [Diplodia seriata]
MSPIIHCVRHAQAYHNLTTYNDISPSDPLLTDYGMQQCEELHNAFPHHDGVTAIVASPLKRTMGTALYAFRSVIASRGIKVIALPEIQENSDLPCDTGSDRVELEREFAGQPTDFSLVREGWNSKKGPWAPEHEAIAERCRVARVFLRDLANEEGDIVVVAHGGLLHSLTQDWSDFDRHDGTGWANMEFRSYTFASNGGDQTPLVETDGSLKHRQGTRMTREDQLQLQERAEEAWAAVGYQLPGKCLA